MPTSAPESVVESWRRIHRWLQSRPDAAGLAGKLLPGVPPEALERVENGLGVKLPADLRQFWQVCGGSRPEEGAEAADAQSWWQPGEWSSDIFPRSIPETMAFSVLSPRGALEAWERLQEWEGFERQWLPIAGDGGGDYQCLNLSAPSNAQHGEVIEWGHEECTGQVLAASLSSYLKQLADGLENGTMGYQSEHGLVRLA